jgi:hypothetical protein
MDRSLLSLDAMKLNCFFTAAAITVLAATGCAGEDDSAPLQDDTAVIDPPELSQVPSELIAKEDGAGIRGLAVDGNYADTQAWTVLNQWEDKTTAAANAAGIAWSANSGLSWDEKYAKWIESLEIVQADTSPFYKTVRITTPWGKTLPSPKLDCADASLMLRATFAAWYRLPFAIIASTGPTVYLGHFGARTATGRWDQSINIGRVYKDFSAAPPADLANWPKDTRLRGMHIHGTRSDGSFLDDLPFYLANGEGTGAYLDELHLNKRAARLIVYLMQYTGSGNLADSANTYNIKPAAIRPSDFLVYRRAPQGTGHTMVMVRVRDIDGGKKEAQNIFGNEPPDQLFVESPIA